MMKSITLEQLINLRNAGEPSIFNPNPIRGEWDLYINDGGFPVAVVKYSRKREERFEILCRNDIKITESQIVNATVLRFPQGFEGVKAGVYTCQL